MIKAVLLGMVQGLTEFLPVSSSGHLAILEHYFKIEEPVVLAAFLHLGTLLATLVYFYKPIRELFAGVFKRDRDSLRYLLFIVIANIPIGLFALFFRSSIESAFSDLKIIAVFLGLSGLFVLLTALIPRGAKKVGLVQAVIIGLGQMFAAFPGLSRSGLTISSAMFSGVEPLQAFKFSFIMSIPAILAANLLELKDISGSGNLLELLAGVLVSFAVGLAALRLLSGLVKKHFYIFGFYCLLISAVLLLIL
jgi:undecaprenyl-diphosphatase